MKISLFSNVKNEKLPKETGIANKAQPLVQRALFNPELTLRANVPLQAQLGKFSPVQPAEIRQNMINRLAKAVDAINLHIQKNMKFNSIRFGMDERTDRTLVTIRDQRTGEVLKTMPSEFALEIAARLRAASGLFINRKG
ncbi:MAG: flagellar protein FlaG [SAR324 cluster bacterium]|nr:flagellar protein FlaG [SAR324 cluster bacterium]